MCRRGVRCSIAVTFTAIGFAFDAGSGGKELTFAFAAAYAVGCVAAVVRGAPDGHLHRRHSASADPVRLRARRVLPLSRRHDRRRQGSADQLRLPTDRAVPADVLHLGGRAVDRARPLVHRACRGVVPRATAEADGVRRTALRNHAKISGASDRGTPRATSAADDAAPRRSRQHSIDRSARTTKTAAASARNRSGRPTKRTQPSRSRHTRPPETEIIEPVVERPRRQRTTRRTTDSTTPPVEPRRRPRSSSSSAREPRKQPPPSERRSPYQRPDRHSRFDGFEPFEPHGAGGSNGNGPHRTPPDLAGALPRCRRRRPAAAIPGPAAGSQASGRGLGVRRLDGV